jgi:hypothetical protein
MKFAYVVLKHSVSTLPGLGGGGGKEHFLSKAKLSSLMLFSEIDTYEYHMKPINTLYFEQYKVL